MNILLSQKEIGDRITRLRKEKGYSQVELSKIIEISRPSLAQIELGNRNITIIEMQKISFALNFSMDEFLSEGYTIDQEVSKEFEKIRKEEDLKKTTERIAIPKLKLNKFKNVLLYILEKCAGKPNVGETVLYKLLYFSDFNHYEKYEEHLTGALYKKLPYGPVPQKLTSVIKQMILDGTLKRIKTEYHNYAQTRYLPLAKPDLTLLKASEKEIIDNVLLQMGDWSAKAISNYSHNDIPWEVTEEGKAIDYELAFYRELPYSVREYQED